MSLLSDNLFVEIKVDGGVLRLAVDAGLEVQMGRGGTSRLSCEGNGLSCLYALPHLYQVLGVVGVVGLQSVGMPDTHKFAIAREFLREDHLTVEGRIDLVLGLRLEVHAGMHPSVALAVGTDNLSPWQRETPSASAGRFRRVVPVGTAG